MNVCGELATRIQGAVVVMGIGSLCRGDDAAGSRVAQQISDVAGVHVIDAQDVPENYLRQVVDQRPNTVVLIDCVDLKSAPGSVALLDGDQMTDYWPSTHRVPVWLLMNYLERETNARVFLIAIQPRHTGLLQPMSEEVSSSVRRIADLLNSVLEMRRMPAEDRFSDPLRGKVAA